MDSLHSAYDAVRQALDMGDVTQALALLKQLLATFPHSIDAHRLLGEAHLQAEQHPEAIAAFERALHADPEHIDALYGLGVAHHQLGNADEARAAFERALEIQPSLAEHRPLLQHIFPNAHTGSDKRSRAGLARLHMRSGRYKRAVDQLRTVLAQQPQRSDLQVALAEALWRANRGAETLRHCYDILALQPQLVKPTLLLAYILIKRKEPGGEALWQRAMAQDPLLTMAHALFPKLPAVTLPTPQRSMQHPAARQASEQTDKQAAPARSHTSASSSNDQALLAQLLGDTPPGTESDEQESSEMANTNTENDVLLEQLLSGVVEPEVAPDNGAAQRLTAEDAEPEDELVSATAIQPADASHNPVAQQQYASAASLQEAVEVIFREAEAEPTNHVLRLAVARLSWRIDAERSLGLYRGLIKEGALVEETIDDLGDYVEGGDPALRQRVYHILGDAYMRQHRLSEAMKAYSQAFPEHARTQHAS
jgi:tetratricopeptide (TPR) repeat protein